VLNPNSSMEAALCHRKVDNRPRESEEELLEGSCMDKWPWEKNIEAGEPVGSLLKQRGSKGRLGCVGAKEGGGVWPTRGT
jgi:hypothetical protein